MILLIAAVDNIFLEASDFCILEIILNKEVFVFMSDKCSNLLLSVFFMGPARINLTGKFGPWQQGGSLLFDTLRSHLI